MTENEKLMLDIMGKVSSSDAPIVFKGAMITRLILAENNFDVAGRATRDTDANWVGNPPSMSHLVETINSSLGDLQNKIQAVPIRDYSDTKSAGVSIIDKDTKEELFSMDISVKPVYGAKIYYHGDIGIKGVLPNEILADKISVMSSSRIFRRMKDCFDVYALSHCVEIKPAEILTVIDAKNHKLLSFDEFQNRTQDLKHAYSKLKGIANKPDFDVVYGYLQEFIKPFKQRDPIVQIWDAENTKWGSNTEISQSTSKDESNISKQSSQVEKLNAAIKQPPPKQESWKDKQARLSAKVKAQDLTPKSKNTIDRDDR